MNDSNSDLMGFYMLTSGTVLTLKLLGIIAWPWFWVLSPLWVPIATAVIIIIAIAFADIVSKMAD